MSMTQKQYQDFVGLRGSEDYPFMKSGADLLNRAIVLDKRKRDKSLYATTEFTPSKRQSDPPEVEWDVDELNPENDFDIDLDKIQMVYNLLQGSNATVSADDDEDDDLEIEEEDDDDATEEVEDDAVEEETKERDEKDVEEDDDDFEDDDLDLSTISGS